VGAFAADLPPSSRERFVRLVFEIDDGVTDDCRTAERIVEHRK
jgi:hypothetical protein